MDFKYRWKHSAPPTRDQAAQSESLLEESQFETEQDHQLAEETARKHLNVPVHTLDETDPVLPQIAPLEEAEQ